MPRVLECGMGTRRLADQLRQFKADCVDIANAMPAGRSFIFFNGDILASIDDPDGYVRRIHALTGFDIHHTPSVSLASSGHVHIYVDEGRLIRPLLGWPLCEPWADHYASQSVDVLVAERRVIYVDSAECITRNICIDVQHSSPDRTDYDAAEVHAILMLGVTASCIPFIQCNQSPREWRSTGVTG